MADAPLVVGSRLLLLCLAFVLALDVLLDSPLFSQPYPNLTLARSSDLWGFLCIFGFWGG